MDTLKTNLENAIAELSDHMNDVSSDFACEYDLTDLDRVCLGDLFSECADRVTPVYYSDVDAECTDEMIDEYLRAMGPISINDSSDLNKVKQAAVFYDYERQLYEDKREILTVIFYRAILGEVESFEGYPFEAIEEVVAEYVDKEDFPSVEILLTKQA